jgi:hypothetical protein
MLWNKKILFSSRFCKTSRKSFTEKGKGGDWTRFELLPLFSSVMKKFGSSRDTSSDDDS